VKHTWLHCDENDTVCLIPLDFADLLKPMSEVTVRACIVYTAVFSSELVVLPDLSLPASPELKMEGIVPGDGNHSIMRKESSGMRRHYLGNISAEGRFDHIPYRACSS
jgi:hypothetical protein